MAPIELVLTKQDHQTAEGFLRPFKPISDIISWYTDWFPLKYDLASNRLYEDSHWNVPKIWEQYDGTNGNKTLILEAEGRIQGFICIRFDHTCHNGKSGVYVPFLSSAPWNRKFTKNDHREFRNIGAILMATAAIKGYKDKSVTRMELHSLPSAENFYEKIGMAKTGNKKNGMNEFYMGAQAYVKLVRSCKRFFRLTAV